VNEINSPWFQLYPDMGNLPPPATTRGRVPAGPRPSGGRPRQGRPRPRVIRGIPSAPGLCRITPLSARWAAAGFWGPLTIEMWGQMDQGATRTPPPAKPAAWWTAGWPKHINSNRKSSKDRRGFHACWMNYGNRLEVQPGAARNAWSR